MIKRDAKLAMRTWVVTVAQQGHSSAFPEVPRWHAVAPAAAGGAGQTKKRLTNGENMRGPCR